VREGGKGLVAPPRNFSLWENFRLVEKLQSKNTKFGAKNPPFGHFRDKIEILSTHKFAYYILYIIKYYKICNFLPVLNFFTHDAATQGYSANRGTATVYKLVVRPSVSSAGSSVVNINRIARCFLRQQHALGTENHTRQCIDRYEVYGGSNLIQN